jgi:hypothetical protein
MRLSARLLDSFGKRLAAQLTGRKTERLSRFEEKTLPVRAGEAGRRRAASRSGEAATLRIPNPIQTGSERRIVD